MTRTREWMRDTVREIFANRPASWWTWCICHVSFILFLAWLVFGCATPRYVIWEKPGGDPAQFRVDRYQCVQESRTSWSGGGGGLIGLSLMASAKSQAQAEADKLFRLCMTARGYAAREARPDEVPAR